VKDVAHWLQLSSETLQKSWKKLLNTEAEGDTTEDNEPKNLMC
jgi:hypothetical protein